MKRPGRQGGGKLLTVSLVCSPSGDYPERQECPGAALERSCRHHRRGSPSCPLLTCEIARCSCFGLGLGWEAEPLAQAWDEADLAEPYAVGEAACLRRGCFAFATTGG